jgi:hypothetical protein
MHYFNNPIIDVFFDTMKKISDKYNLGLEDGFAVSEENEEVFIHLSFTSNVSMKVSMNRLLLLKLNENSLQFMKFEEVELSQDNSFIQRCDDMISVHTDCHLFVLLNNQINDAPINIVFNGYSMDSSIIYADRAQHSDILDMGLIGLKITLKT